MDAPKVYGIHDNGGRPFKVLVNKKHVQIYALDHIYGNNYYEEPFYNQTVHRVFVGLSPLNKMTKFSGGHGPKFDGNSLLLHERDLTYVWVGEHVQRFQTIAPIVSYISPVGNNDVPYPYAIDNQNNYYLMIVNVILNSDHPLLVLNPYNYYYTACMITDNIQHIPPSPPLFEYLDNIREFWKEYWDYGNSKELHNYGNQQYSWCFQLDYKEQAYELKNAYIVYADGSKQNLDPKTYISIMEKAGARAGVVGLIDGETIHKRIW